MVKKFIAQNLKKIKLAVPKIEKKIKVKININENTLIIKGNEYLEYITETMLKAIDFGFETEDAFLLLNEEYVLEFIYIKSNTRRKNLKDVRARVIGTNGKAMKTIENLTNSAIVLKDNLIGVIVNSENLDITIQSIESLIRGSKHANVFSYIERNKTKNKHFFSKDLGLKEKAKNLEE